MEKFIIVLTGLFAAALIISRIKRIFKDGSCDCLQDCSSCLYSEKNKPINVVLDQNEEQSCCCN